MIATQVPPSSLTIAKPFFRSDHAVGSGAYGEVWVEHGKPDRVVKVYERGAELTSSVIREISAFNVLRRAQTLPCVPYLYGIYLEDEAHRISMERMDHSLSTVIGKQMLPESHVKNMLTQVLTTLAILAEFNITHRDVKPGNILCKSSMCDFRLCDFGLSRFSDVSERDHLTGDVQTLWYKAPEVISEKMANDRGNYLLDKIDIWSLGIVAIELLSGHACTPASNDAEQLNEIHKKFGGGGNPRKPMKDIIGAAVSVSADLITILDSMTSIDPVERPTAKELLGLEYFGRQIRVQMKGLNRLDHMLVDIPLDADMIASSEYRDSAVQKIREVYDEAGFENPETLFSAVMFLDILISIGFLHDIDDKICDEIAMACSLLSAKVHESSLIGADLIIDHFGLDILTVFRMEREIFKSLDCNLFIPSMYTYAVMINRQFTEVQTLMDSLALNEFYHLHLESHFRNILAEI